MSAFRRYYLLAVIRATAIQVGHAATVPTHVGGCVNTKVKRVTTRLFNTPGSGSAVYFTNGGYQVSYDTVSSVDISRPGDPVRMRLVSVPKDCPPGDDRGRVYKTTNLRTHSSWHLPEFSPQLRGSLAPERAQ